MLCSMKLIFMKFVPILWIFFQLCQSGPVTKASKPFTPTDAETYLTKFGYLQVLPEPRSSSDLKEYNVKKAEQKSKAIQLFQEFAGLPKTGKIDDKTTDKMLAPRCGISDLDSLKRDGAMKWEKRVLQWAVKQFTGQLTEGDIRQALKQAFDIWSKVVPLDFVEVHPDSTDADIQVKFASGQHDDPYAFDGNGRVLAHAFYPKDGRLHFDDDEKWAFNDRKKLTDDGYTDLLSVATHELGHSLGLAHSKDQSAVMVPYYTTPKESGVALGDDDIQRIQQLYGSRKGAKVLGTPAPTTTTTTRVVKPQPKPQPNPNPKQPIDGGTPDKKCPTTIDAATTAMNDYSYFFYGNSVWIVDNSGKATGPKFVDQVFPQGPTSGVTAAVTNQNSQLTLLFQNRQVYAFEWNARDQKFVLQNDFPKQMTDDIPFVPKSAFRWTDRNVVLSNGDDFVTFDEYWNKATFKNKVSNYFSSLLSSSSAEVFNNQGNIIILNGAKYSIFDLNSKQTSSPLSQLLKC